MILSALRNPHDPGSPPRIAVTARSHPIACFLELTLAISSIFYALIIGTGHTGGARGAYATGLMWCPGIAALLTCRLCRIPLRSLGWQWGAWRWQWLAYAMPLTYAACAYAVVWFFGYGDFPDPAFVAWTRRGLGWTSAPDWLVLAGGFMLVATTGMVASSAQALGEEIGWRGFLTPRMTGQYGEVRGALLTGALWAAWHLPILLFADYHSETPWWYGLGCFTVMVLGMSVIMAWLRSRSGSLWTGVVFHASHNLFIQGFFTPATRARGMFTSFAIDEFGFSVPLMVGLLALSLLAVRKAGPVRQDDTRR